MGVRPFNFKCDKCKKGSYVDGDKCHYCDNVGTIKPIPKEVYRCFLNGEIYGVGSLDYMRELFTDYVVTCKMYGKKECDFKVVKD